MLKKPQLMKLFRIPKKFRLNQKNFVYKVFTNNKKIKPMKNISLIEFVLFLILLIITPQTRLWQVQKCGFAKFMIIRDMKSYTNKFMCFRQATTKEMEQELYKITFKVLKITHYEPRKHLTNVINQTFDHSIIDSRFIKDAFNGLIPKFNNPDYKPLESDKIINEKKNILFTDQKHEELTIQHFPMHYDWLQINAPTLEGNLLSKTQTNQWNCDTFIKIRGFVFAYDVKSGSLSTLNNLYHARFIEEDDVLMCINYINKFSHKDNYNNKLQSLMILKDFFNKLRPEDLTKVRNLINVLQARKLESASTYINNRDIELYMMDTKIMLHKYNLNLKHSIFCTQIITKDQVAESQTADLKIPTIYSHDFKRNVNIRSKTFIEKYANNVVNEQWEILKGQKSNWSDSYHLLKSKNYIAGSDLLNEKYNCLEGVKKLIENAN